MEDHGNYLTIDCPLCFSLSLLSDFNFRPEVVVYVVILKNRLQILSLLLWIIVFAK